MSSALAFGLIPEITGCWVNCGLEVSSADRVVGWAVLCGDLLGKYFAVCQWRRCIWFRYRYQAFGAVVLPATVGDVGVAEHWGMVCVAQEIALDKTKAPH